MAAFFLAGVLQASADITQVIPEFGDLDRWGVFTLGNSSHADRFSADSLVTGDVGVAGNADVTLKDNATINGDLYYGSNGKLKTSGSAIITGASFHNQDSLLDMAVNQAIAASKAAATFQSTRPFTDINLEGSQSTTVMGGLGETVVLNLKNFRLHDNSTFTLQGTTTTTFIINVKRQFALSGNAAIVLSGGVLFNDVLFNVRGRKGNVRLTGNSHFEGVLLATRRTIKMMDQATANATIIGGRILLRNGATITHPPVTSP
jgi:Ice-binding-like